jgi:BirA family biotin operon repressor/biotin-[acetyl-CoA-carboxylase] ligase
VKPAGIFTEVVELAEVDSTNRYALDLGRPGVAVKAASQSAGRGRRGRSWFSPAGSNLYITYTLSPVRAHHAIVAGVAAREALASLVPWEEVHLKWPNDIVASRRKLCGILCEVSGGITAVGMGVNVNQAEWPAGLGERSVSLMQLSGTVYDVEDVASLLTDRLSFWVRVYARDGFGPVREEFLAHGLLQDYPVTDHEGRPCTIVDMTDDGHLVIDDGSGRRVLVGETISIGWERVW